MIVNFEFNDGHVEIINTSRPLLGDGTYRMENIDKNTRRNDDPEFWMEEYNKLPRSKKIGGNCTDWNEWAVE